MFACTVSSNSEDEHPSPRSHISNIESHDDQWNPLVSNIRSSKSLNIIIAYQILVAVFDSEQSLLAHPISYRYSQNVDKRVLNGTSRGGVSAKAHWLSGCTIEANVLCWDNRRVGRGHEYPQALPIGSGGLTIIFIIIIIWGRTYNTRWHLFLRFRGGKMRRWCAMWLISLAYHNHRGSWLQLCTIPPMRT